MLQMNIFMEDIFTALSMTNIFKGLTPGNIEELLHDKPYRTKKYVRDEYIAYSHEVCNDMLIVVAGTVRGEMADFSGKKLKIEDIEAPRPLAAAFIFGHENRFPVDIIANEPAVIMVVPRDVLIFLLQDNQVILKNYLNVISSRTQFLSNKIRFLSFKTIKEKIANYLLNNLGNKSNTIIINQSQTELADFFGVARPSLARALSEMQEEGFISVKRRIITIIDKEKLNKLLL
jgi:CRP/FNR family transcriptional regulator, dissimilatory nitrate respiration regulator